MDAPAKLSNATTRDLPDDVAVPAYDRSRLTPGIVHIGVGNFHRAHQAWYVHRLMQRGLALDWGIVGAGVRPEDERRRLELAGQDYLTTLIELAPSGRSAEIAGSIIDFVPVEEGHGPLIERIADPEIRIVSLTITEGGYYLDPANGGFDSEHADIRHDAESPERPRTAFGAIVAALRRRRASGLPPLALQSCDNLRGNGDVLRRAVVSLARLSDPDLADWIDAECSFPNSMVDCIVPATGAGEIALARELGVDDAAPVIHENFRQWVIEDAFPAGRPDWNEVGAVFERDVHGYEDMKIKILNGGHQILANAGEMLSLATVADCMAHELVGRMFRAVQLREVLPHVAAVPAQPAEAYLDTIVERFSNPAIRDTTRRVSFDAVRRHGEFVLPVIRDALATGAHVRGLALVEALLARMSEGRREDGTEIEPNGPGWKEFRDLARRSTSQPELWLREAGLYGEIAEAPEFAGAFAHWLTQIRDDGAENAIRAYLAE